MDPMGYVIRILEPQTGRLSNYLCSLFQFAFISLHFSFLWIFSLIISFFSLSSSVSISVSSSVSIESSVSSSFFFFRFHHQFFLLSSSNWHCFYVIFILGPAFSETSSSILFASWFHSGSSCVPGLFSFHSIFRHFPKEFQSVGAFFRACDIMGPGSNVCIQFYPWTILTRPMVCNLPAVIYCLQGDSESCEKLKELSSFEIDESLKNQK